MREKFRKIEEELNERFIERQEVARGLLVGLLSRQHVLLLGPPGTAKSEMAENLCARIGGKYFRWLLASTSTPEELFGPISLKALEQDSYRRITAGKLPEASIAFVDEIFKCNSAVLNSMLSILNERLFFNDGQPTPVPLEMVVGASNELPEDREELAALWDRFLLRFVVGYIREPKLFEKMLLASGDSFDFTSVTMEELKAAQSAVKSVDASGVTSWIISLREEIRKLGISVSDRRWKQCLDLLRANAWLEGRARVESEDLEILSAALWQEPGQIPQVRAAVMALANPLDEEALKLLDAAMEAYKEAMRATDEKAVAVGTEVNAKLKKAAKRLQELISAAKEKGKSDTRIADALQKVVTWNKEVIAKCLGISI